MKKKIIVIFSIVIIIAICTFILICLKTNLFRNIKDNTTLKHRKNYIICKDINLSNYINKKDKTLVIFWATWCSYCLEEAEALNEYIKYNPYKSIIIVSHDYNKDDIKNYLEEKGYNWFVILDPQKTIRENLDPDSKGIPSCYLLNQEGKIINYHKGKFTTEEFKNFFNKVEI